MRFVCVDVYIHMCLFICDMTRAYARQVSHSSESQDLSLVHTGMLLFISNELRVYVALPYMSLITFIRASAFVT